MSSTSLTSGKRRGLRRTGSKQTEAQKAAQKAEEEKRASACIEEIRELGIRLPVGSPMQVLADYEKVVPKWRDYGQVAHFSPRLTAYGKEELRLSPDVLEKRILPFISALATIQRVATGSAAEHLVPPPRIVRISQNSPINISMQGIPDAYKALKDDIIPWRRRHAQAIAEIQRKQAEIELEVKRAEIMSAEAKASKEVVDIDRLRAEVAQKVIENDRARLALKREQFELAMSIVDRLCPNADELTRIQAFNMVAGAVTEIEASTVEVGLGVSEFLCVRREETFPR